MTKNTIVGDSSPIIALSIIQQLELLPNTVQLQKNGIYIRQSLIDAVLHDVGEIS
jgi:predicted nucleic acid-binding protein